ncbi:hypothetical protein NEOLEDRAFT_1158450 [Neolentinus lepideus HHB14362 ss-1]|uniref:DUF1275 domain protein n=1 Tax=Neolentinus lepideus HHB14362 ss-1 TaxID=1314782 RepID=A0A165PDG8_9AGAM|nr:hypothetical protein NEOLEDRAFT_1158450 [Neolentinus lepideus HHB14362 ss-1]
MSSVKAEWASAPLIAYCFMTGYIDAIGFTAVFVWPGFQTGNSVQLALAIARLFQPGQTDFSFRPPDRAALVSLLTFIFGAFLGRIGDRMGPKTRAWLFLGTMIQALFTMAAAVCIWQSGNASVASDRGDPAWTAPLAYVALGFMSASLGLQGIIGKRVNGQFATTIVLTTIWCELMADPKLFNKSWVITRDHKIVAIICLFLGGFIGRAILDSIGSAGALGVGTGFRVVIAVWWLFVGEPKAQAKTAEKN